MATYTVTWPTLPDGVYTVAAEASTPAEAIRIATAEEKPTTPGYRIDLTAEPEIWLCKRPYSVRSRHIQGPHYDRPAAAR